MNESRKGFEDFWRKEMNSKVMPLWRTNFPMTDYCDQAYECHETNRSWITWQASRQYLESYPGLEVKK